MEVTLPSTKRELSERVDDSEITQQLATLMFILSEEQVGVNSKCRHFHLLIQRHCLGQSKCRSLSTNIANRLSVGMLMVDNNLAFCTLLLRKRIINWAPTL